MNIKMRLHEMPFNMIKNGDKKIEYRLNDEKRQQLKVGDTITFFKRPLEEETLEVKIVDLKYYDNLLDMYKASFKEELSRLYDSPEEAVEDTEYYTDEEIKKYGCLAIHIEIIDE